MALRILGAYERCPLAPLPCAAACADLEMQLRNAEVIEQMVARRLRREARPDLAGLRIV